MLGVHSCFRPPQKRVSKGSHADNNIFGVLFPTSRCLVLYYINAMESELIHTCSDAKSSAGATLNVALKSVRFASSAKVRDRHKISQSVSLPRLMKPRCFHVSPAPMAKTTSAISRRLGLNANKKRIARQFSQSMDTMGYFCFNAERTNTCTHNVIAS